jgi:hypothetical protein
MNTDISATAQVSIEKSWYKEHYVVPNIRNPEYINLTLTKLEEEIEESTII